METKTVLKASFAAALVAFACSIFMAICKYFPEEATLQTSHTVTTVSEFMKPLITSPNRVLWFFAADSLLVLSYLMVFIGLYTIVRERSRVFALMGLGAGILAGLLDLIENSFFIIYASMSLKNFLLPEPELPLIYIVANLKMMGALAVFFAFGLVWPRKDWFGKIISVFMFLFVLFGVLRIVIPIFEKITVSFLAFGFPLFAWYFWRHAKKL